MSCENIRERLGAYLDEEVASDERRTIALHLNGCAACCAELQSLQDLATQIAARDSAGVPEALWSAIERRLDDAPAPSLTLPRSRRSRTRWALAAGVVMSLSAGLWSLARFGDGAASAQAAVDFSVLLDQVSLDADAAFGSFLTHYGARPVGPLEAKYEAAHLNFDTPPSLPGGFQRDGVYLLRFGQSTGVAARYRRDGELLCAIFHPPVRREDFGTHRDYPCVVGEHHGHKVTVGAWKLVHLTDPTTCHCVLSKLDESTELPAIMAAIAPAARSADTHTHHGHKH